MPSKELESYNPSPNVTGSRDTPPELIAAYKDVRKLGNLIFQSSEKSTAIPDSIYHYTSMNALFSIIENGVLHFSDEPFMNDPAEGKVISTNLRKAISCREHELWTQYRTYSQDVELKHGDVRFPPYSFF